MMNEINERVTENTDKINVVRKAIDNTESEDVHRHSWIAGIEDREQIGTILYSVEFSIIAEETGVVLVRGYNNMRCFIGSLPSAVEVFNHEVNKSHEDADIVDEAHYADEFNLV